MLDIDNNKKIFHVNKLTPNYNISNIIENSNSPTPPPPPPNTHTSRVTLTCD